MTEAPKLKPCPFCGHDDMIIVDGDQHDDWCAVRCEKCMAQGPHNYTDPHAKISWNRRDDAEVQRLVAEARAEAFEEAANVVGDRRDANTAIWEKTGNPGWLAVLAHLDQARDAILALSDAPPRQVTPQEAAKVLADWIDSDMVSANQLINSIEGVTMETPLRHWLSQCVLALANGGDSDAEQP